MQTPEGITEREFRVLAAVIQIYVETAEPAGSQAVAHRSRLGISPASIRSTMSELESKGLLFHAHTSGGRILNERLAGLALREIRASLPERLRDAAGLEEGRGLLNIFAAQGDELFDLTDVEGTVVLGSAQPLAEQPEFASNTRMRHLLDLT